MTGVIGDVMSERASAFGGSGEMAHGRITVAPGLAATYVITGQTPEEMRLMAFPDF